LLFHLFCQQLSLPTMHMLRKGLRKKEFIVCTPNTFVFVEELMLLHLIRWFFNKGSFQIDLQKKRLNLQNSHIFASVFSSVSNHPGQHWKKRRFPEIWHLCHSLSQALWCILMFNYKVYNKHLTTSLSKWQSQENNIIKFHYHI